MVAKRIKSEFLETLRGAFVDLEIETIEGFLGGSLASLKPAPFAWIASYHNFQETAARSTGHLSSAEELWSRRHQDCNSSSQLR